MRRQKQLINADKKQKLLPDYGRKRLLTYADSFRELAEVFEEMPQKEQEEERDRQEVLWKKSCGIIAGLWRGSYRNLPILWKRLRKNRFAMKR